MEPEDQRSKLWLSGCDLFQDSYPLYSSFFLKMRELAFPSMVSFDTGVLQLQDTDKHSASAILPHVLVNHLVNVIGIHPGNICYSSITEMNHTDSLSRIFQSRQDKHWEGCYTKSYYYAQKRGRGRKQLLFLIMLGGYIVRIFSFGVPFVYEPELKYQ